MGRIIAGFVLAPMSLGLAAGTFGLFLLPIMYFFMLVVAVPLFLLCKRLGWLGWWHAALAGFITAAAFVVLYWHGANPYHIEIYGPSNAVDFLLIGTVIGLIFWAIAIFGNPALPQRQVKWQAIVLAVAVLVLVRHFYRNHVLPSGALGAVLSMPTQQANIAYLTVRLDSGEIVPARVMSDTAKSLTPNRPVYLEARGSMISPRRLYWVTGCRDDPQC